MAAIRSCGGLGEGTDFSVATAGCRASNRGHRANASIKVEPVARLFAIAYAVFGAGAFLFFMLTQAAYLTLPVGVVGLFGLVHLNVNFNLPRPSSVPLSFLYGLGEVVAYGFTGWLTGAASALCFNLVARVRGGINAKFITLIDTGELMASEAPAKLP